jgi:murein DD-endopeptidase MepM/ murein hydrolase activator NlpD
LGLLLLIWLSSAALAEILADPITYRKESQGSRDTIILTNTCAVPISVKLSLTLSNVGTLGPTDLIAIPGFASVRGPTFYPINPEAAWKYNWTYRYNFGSYLVSEPSAPFALPWAPGQSYRAGQAFGGDLSHWGDDRYAVDFPMPEGTPIHAAGAGLVCYVRENYSEGGWRTDLRDKDNHVLIAHQDGTISRYLHLRQYGAEVELGQWVEAGELIGYSGNVGYSSGPHLHFDVVRPGKDLVTQTIPFELLDGGVPVTPVKDMMLSH